MTASRLLAPLVDEAPDDLALRLLLARAYYHSVQLGRAEATLREILDRDPVESYGLTHVSGVWCSDTKRHSRLGPRLRAG